MPALVHHPCKFFVSLPTHSFPLNNFTLLITHQKLQTPNPSKPPKFNSISQTGSAQLLVFRGNYSILRNTHVCFCSKNDVIEETTATQVPQDQENKVELLDKPSPKEITYIDEPQKPGKDDVLRPFLKFFKPSGYTEQLSDVEETSDGDGDGDGDSDNDSLRELEVSKKVSVEYYDPKSGDFVVGVVVSGNENKLDVNIGADLLGTMLTKEVLPLYGKELDFLLCDIGTDAKEFSVNGKMGIVKSEDALSVQTVPGRPVVDPGTLLFAEVYGRTLSGRPLLSTRRFFRRVAWHRVRQIKQLNEPIEVKITEWNTGGLLARIEGLRAFLPKAELVKRINNFTDLKNCVGNRMYVQISRINEDTNDLVLSEKEAWSILNLRDGTLLEGTVQKIYSFGVQVRIGESFRRYSEQNFKLPNDHLKIVIDGVHNGHDLRKELLSSFLLSQGREKVCHIRLIGVFIDDDVRLSCGLLHISNISRARVTSADDVLKVNEKIKVLVVKSLFPDKISLSIADLESEPGLFLTNKKKVFSEAEKMAKKYRQRRPASSATRKIEPLQNKAMPFEDEASMYANWKWFKFETSTDQNDSS